MGLELIGITGKAGSGKDFAGQVIASTFGYKLFGFAHALKLEGLSRGFTPEEVFLTKPPHIRRWLQLYGVDQRTMHPFTWITKASQIIEVMGWTRVLFTDVRFRNEHDWIVDRGGIVFRMDPEDRPYPLAGTLEAMHVSETEMDWFPGCPILHNGMNVTREDLVAQAELILFEHGGML